MSSKQITYVYNNKEYPVVITRKSIKSIRYTYRSGVFYVSAPYLFVTESKIKSGLDKFAEKLIKSDVKSAARGENYIYILGDKIFISSSGEISFTDGEKIAYKSQEDLDKKLKKWFLKYIEKRHRYYEQLMEIKKPYKVRVRKMSSRYGSNSYQTHTVCYSLVLFHYTSDVIDSVIVHEIAHDKVHNHSKNFYNVVYKYCPNYKALDKRLKKGIFQ